MSCGRVAASQGRGRSVSVGCGVSPAKRRHWRKSARRMLKEIFVERQRSTDALKGRSSEDAISERFERRPKRREKATQGLPGLPAGERTNYKNATTSSTPNCWSEESTGHFEAAGRRAADGLANKIASGRGRGYEKDTDERAPKRTRSAASFFSVDGRVCSTACRCGSRRCTDSSRPSPLTSGTPSIQKDEMAHEKRILEEKMSTIIAAPRKGRAPARAPSASAAATS